MMAHSLTLVATWAATLAEKARRAPVWAMVLIIAAMLSVQAGFEFAIGRVPMCTCGTIKLWVGGSTSPETSQQIFDWYSLSHVIHGFGLYGLTWLLLPRAPIAARLILAVAVECSWEMLENTNLIIDRYRAGTISLNYYGDSIVNSISDTSTMMFGFGLAYWLPVWTIVTAAVLLEALAGYVIRDNLTLNIIMLIYPFEAIRAWQGGASVH
ncbi:MAG TPA: DUF2585 domain-containing protein [Xanthobacteraceae bacterium]|jgi:hypothetical protein|nr:DUF2585 domain-containing protein [Xanthobacteraceae bacterium]